MKWGIYCLASNCLFPRYKARTMREAQKIRKQADQECQAKARHEIRALPVELREVAK